jgi:tape measure domain-containing protein|nr:MAG TPA: tail tape measure [Caudoviricetes sp.]
MSTTIDQRVVEMQFDNKQFERNVATSMSTLDKLKQSLNLSGASKGLENVGTATKKCDMSGLSGAVQTVQAKFTALEVMAVTALANITNSAINAGKRLVSSLTIDPIKMGFQEYETQINAIQTILANTSSKGTTLEQVNSALDELNTYADKTIYNFTEMTRNIGTFTAAGVDLDTSVSAIKGIANLAAVSGSTSQQASTAMYQLSQALASGTVKLMDWNSVVNAGMGGQVFQDALKETARLHGVAIDEMIESEGSFRETLKTGWLTSEVLTETLAKFTGDLNEEQLRTMGYTEDQIQAILKMGQTANDAATKVKTFTQLFDTLKEAAQSGWTQSWEIIIGDFEEAKELLTEVSDIFGGLIGASADARNAVLQGWKDLGGRTEIIEALRNTFEGVMSIVTPIKEAFKEIFPPITAQQLYAFSEGLRKLTEHLKLSDETSANLKSTFKGLFAILDIVKQAFSAVFNAVKPLFGGLDDLGGGILSVTGACGDWLVKLNETIKTTDIFNKVVQGVVDFVKAAATAVKDFIKSVAEKFNFPGLEIFHSFLERVQERMSQVGEAASAMKSGVVVALEIMGEALANSKFLQALEALWQGVKTIVGGIASALGSLTGGLVEKIGNADFSGALDIINSLIAGGIGVGLMKFLKSVTDTFKGFQDITDGIVDIFDGVRGCLEAYQTQLKAGTLLKIAGAIGILAASIIAISLIDSDKLAAALGAITVLFADLMGSMAIFGKISGNLTGVFKTTTVMLGLSVAVLILASALKKIGDLDFKQLVTGLVGVVGLTATMVAAAKILGSGSSTMIKGATQMVIFSAAIKILASACEDLSKLSWEDLAKGLVGVGVLMAEISLFLNTAKFSGKSITTATGIVILAAAIKILASACEDFGQMEWGEIGKGLAAIGALLAEVALFTNLTGNAKHVISTGVALIAIGAAMKIFASAVQDMSNLTWEELAKGLAGMAGALLAVTAAVNFMPKNMISIGAGLIAVSTALVIMASALDKLGGMSWEGIAKGLVALGGSITILAVGLNVMTGTLPGSAALLVAAAALAVLTPVLSILGAMSWESIAKGLVSIAGAFAVIGVAGLVLTPLVPTILGLGAAFALIGVGVLGIGAGLLAAGAGLSAVAVGFTALATAGAAGATAIVASLTVIITGVASLIPAVIEKIGEGIIAFCKVIADGAPAIGEAVKAVVLSLVDVMVECVPALADGVLAILAGLLAALVEYTPQIVDSLFQFLIGILEGVARNLPGLIKAAIDVLMAFFAGVVDALSGIDVEVLIKGIAGIGLLSAIMLALAAVAALVPAAMVGVLGMGVVIAELALVLAAIGALAQIPGLTWLINEGAELMEGIGNAIGSFIGGIVGGFMSGVSSSFPKIGADLSAFMTNVQPFIDGARKIDAATMDGVKALAETILILTAANILEGLTSWFTGGSSMTKFGQELAEFGPYFNDYYESIKGIDGSVVEASANAALALAQFAKEIPNSGGVVGWFAGENSLSVFAEELMEFGPKLKAYADSVKGLDASVVINSANAAKALAEMATNLPNSGGVVGWFTGENDLSTFAEELMEFGPKLKAYADSVRGLNGDVVVNSANAAKALAEMANNLPNQGGAVSWFTGDNTLTMFGDELAAFGPSLKAYADSVRGLDGNVVVNSANAAKALSELSTNLPNTGGIVSWFTGDNDIASFGQQLVSFGQSFASYYASVSTVNTAQLSGVVQEFKNLVDLANGIKSVDTSGMASFSQNLTALGNSGIEGFINAFTNANSRVSTAANTMITTFINSANAKKAELTNTFNNLVQAIITAINGKQILFTTAGNALMTKFIAGIKSQDVNSRTALVNIISGCLTVIKNKYYEFHSTAQALMVQFIAGIRAKDSAVSNTFVQILGGALTAIKNKYTDFYNAGKYLVEGFAEGITANTYLAEARARAMAAAAARAAERELDEHSPSRVGYRIGDFFGVAFVTAIGDYVSKAYKVGSEVANSAKRGLSTAASKITDLINGNIDTQPTIRPVLDLSDVESGTGRLNALFSRSRAMSISAGMNRTPGEEIQNGAPASGAGNTFTFTQNNYSPKALSRLEIYRQTKNQFSAMKGLVEA